MNILRKTAESTFAHYRHNFLEDHADRPDRYELLHAKAVQLSNKPYVKMLGGLLLGHSDNKLDTGGVKVALAAGANKTGEIPEALLYHLGFDVNIVGTVTYEPHTGNEQKQRIWDMGNGTYRNFLGLPNPGVIAARANWLKVSDDRVKTRFSLMQRPGSSGQEALDDILSSYEALLCYADEFEINLSCPNVDHGNMDEQINFGKKLINALGNYHTTEDPSIYLKLGPVEDLSYLGQIIDVASKNKNAIAGFTTTNTFPRADEEHADGLAKGGVSGADIQIHAKRSLGSLVKKLQFYKPAGFKLNVVGGIATGNDAAERVSYEQDWIQIQEVQLYTALFTEGLGAIRDIKRGLHQRSKSMKK